MSSRLNVSQKIVIYGAGYCGLMFAELLESVGIIPEYFFDKAENKKGKCFKGIKVCPPVFLEEIDCIIVAILNKEIYPEIASYLAELGYENVKSIYDLCEDEILFKNQKLIFYVPDDWKKYNEKQISKVLSYLGDDLSKRTYMSIIDSITGDATTNIPHDLFEQQYFAYDIYNKTGEEVFVDCGAFRGDVLRFFYCNVNHEFKQYIAIEPDPSNYARIELLEEAKDERVQIVKCALSNKREILQIQNYLNENSVIGNTGVSVEAFTFDEVCKGNNIKPTFVKIDVEGFEEKLLNGAEKVLKEYQPIVAIAIYHKVDDLWEIPIRIREILPGHRLYIRSYMNVNETILYAIPEERCVM